MNIITPFAHFFASPVQGGKTVIFAHSPQQLSRLFLAVGLSVEVQCLYSEQFGCYVAFAAPESDDFTLLMWALKDIADQGFFVSRYRRPTSIKKAESEAKLLLSASTISINLGRSSEAEPRGDCGISQTLYWVTGAYRSNTPGDNLDFCFSVANNALKVRFFAGSRKVTGRFAPSNDYVIGNINLIRRLLFHCVLPTEDLSYRALNYLLKTVGFTPNGQLGFLSNSSYYHSTQDHTGLWDGDFKNLGFMARDNGGFGSLCLSDCYGEDSTGDERSYYDD